jgi:phospholipid transport system substrate-binding protein
MVNRMRTIIAVAVLMLATGASAQSTATSPTEELRRYTDRILEVLRRPGLSPASRRATVRDLAIEVFDVEEAAKRALGPHWQRRTPAEREEFVRLFRDLLEQTYVARIDEYGGERLRFVNEQIEGDTATVRAVIVTRTGIEVPIEARLLNKGRWLIYDIRVENIGLIANYRAQFDRVIRTSSYEDLVQRLKSRIQFLMEGRRAAGRAPDALPVGNSEGLGCPASTHRCAAAPRGALRIEKASATMGNVVATARYAMENSCGMPHAAGPQLIWMASGWIDRVSAISLDGR